MTFLEQTRNYEQMKKDWVEECYNKSKSKNSREAALGMFRHFEKFIAEKYPGIAEEKIFDELKNLAKDLTSTRVYQFINEFVQFMISKGLAPRTIQLYSAFFKRYLRYHGIRVYNEDVKNFVKLPKVIKERKVALTYEIINSLLDRAGRHYKAIILVLVSSGLRVGEFLQLKYSDLDFTGTYPKITVRAEIAKTREERITFISREAYEAWKPFIEDGKADEYITPGGMDNFGNIEKAFAEIRKRAGLHASYVTGIHHVTIHTFRSFFITQFEKKHQGFGHAPAGHGKYMKEYERLSDEELAQFYSDCEPSVTMNNDVRFKKVIAQKDEQLTKMEEMKEKIRSLEMRMYRMVESQRKEKL